jgi:hypothetical protein
MARLAQLDGNTVAFGPGVADAGRLIRGGLRACPADVIGAAVQTLSDFEATN